MCPPGESGTRSRGTRKRRAHHAHRAYLCLTCCGDPAITMMKLDNTGNLRRDQLQFLCPLGESGTHSRGTRKRRARRAHLCAHPAITEMILDITGDLRRDELRLVLGQRAVCCVRGYCESLGR